MFLRLNALLLFSLTALASDRRPSLSDALMIAQSTWGIQTAARLEWRHLNSCHHPTDSAALTTAGSFTIYINSGCKFTDAQLLILVEHELGHYIGLAHSPDPASVMYWQLGADRTITVADRERVKEIQCEAPK